jgi:hypothetical protein
LTLKRFIKDPQEVLDYTIDWSEWLVSGDTINAVTVTTPTGISTTTSGTPQTPAGPTVISGVATKIWVAGGTAGTSYNIACRVTTVGTRQGERSITIQVRDL